MIVRRIRPVLYCMTTLSIFTACGDVVAVHVFPPPLCLPLALGDSAYLVASADRSNFPVQAYSSVTKPEGFSWSSSDPAVISVNRFGLIHAKSIGVATISVTAEGFTGTSEIHVAQVGQTASVDPAALALGVGDTVMLHAHAWDNAGAPIQLTGGQVLFSTGGDARFVDVVDIWPDGGRAIGVAPGSANVTWGVGQRCGVISVFVR
jgi:hypothetical protein